MAVEIVGFVEAPIPMWFPQFLATPAPGARTEPATNRFSRTPKEAQSTGRRASPNVLALAPSRALRSTPAAAMPTGTARHQPDVEILLLVHPP